MVIEWNMVVGGGVVFGGESVGEGISNSLWGDLSKFIGGLGAGKKEMVIKWNMVGGGRVVFGEESVGEGISNSVCRGLL